MKSQTHLMKPIKPVKLISLLALMALVLAACQSTAKSTATLVPVAPVATDTPVATATTAAAAFQEPTIALVADPKFGQILVDGNGMTLYAFTNDKPNQSNCDASCMAYWPPLLTQGKPIAGTGVDASLLGSTALSDGRMIVTYNQMPLYYFIKDSKASDVTGEGVQNAWYVVNPQGMTVTASLATPTAAAAAFQEPTINIETNSTLGQILDDGQGQTLYVFTKDGPDKSTCVGKCATLWPPLLTEGHPIAGPGLDGSLLSTAPLTDGQMVVTYNKMPLYTWTKDTKAGDTNGEGVGGVWFVVNPQGTIVQPPAATPTAASAAFQEPTIIVASDPKLGQILVDGKGMTLYMFTSDKPDQSTCNAGCMGYWPPLLTQGKPIAGNGVDASLLGSAMLSDGRMIVTYNHMPLYYFVKDAKAGDVTGQGVQNVWYVVSPSGQAVMK